MNYPIIAISAWIGFLFILIIFGFTIRRIIDKHPKSNTPMITKLLIYFVIGAVFYISVMNILFVLLNPLPYFVSFYAWLIAAGLISAYFISSPHKSITKRITAVTARDVITWVIVIGFASTITYIFITPNFYPALPTYDPFNWARVGIRARVRGYLDYDVIQAYTNGFAIILNGVLSAVPYVNYTQFFWIVKFDGFVITALTLVAIASVAVQMYRDKKIWPLAPLFMVIMSPRTYWTRGLDPIPSPMANLFFIILISAYLSGEFSEYIHIIGIGAILIHPLNGAVQYGLFLAVYALSYARKNNSIIRGVTNFLRDNGWKMALAATALFIWVINVSVLYRPTWFTNYLSYFNGIGLSIVNTLFILQTSSSWTQILILRGIRIVAEISAYMLIPIDEKSPHKNRVVLSYTKAMILIGSIIRYFDYFNRILPIPFGDEILSTKAFYYYQYRFIYLMTWAKITLIISAIVSFVEFAKSRKLIIEIPAKVKDTIDKISNKLSSDKIYTVWILLLIGIPLMLNETYRYPQYVCQEEAQDTVLYLFDYLEENGMGNVTIAYNSSDRGIIQTIYAVMTPKYHYIEYKTEFELSMIKAHFIIVKSNGNMSVSEENAHVIYNNGEYKIIRFMP